jgi:hypothetical protein
VVQCEGKEILEKLEHMPTFIKNVTEQLNFHYYKISVMTNILTAPPSRRLLHHECQTSTLEHPMTVSTLLILVHHAVSMKISHSALNNV